MGEFELRLRRLPFIPHGAPLMTLLGDPNKWSSNIFRSKGTLFRTEKCPKVFLRCDCESEA